MADDHRCSRCDDSIAPGDGVIVPGLTAAGPAHEECVPGEYRDFMELINSNFSRDVPLSSGEEPYRGLDR